MDSNLYFIFFIGIISAYFGSFSSGGVSALSIALLASLGMPPQMAGITFKLGKIGDTLGWVYHFHKWGHIPKDLIFGGGIALMIGSFLGSYFIVSLSDTIMYLGCGLSMLILTFVSTFRKVSVPGKISDSRKYSGFLGYFVLSIVGNLFPAGSWVWYYFNNTLILRLTPLQSKWIASVLAFFWFIGTLLGILSAWVYRIDWALALGLGMLIWGHFGTKHIIKIGDELLRYILLTTIAIFALYFLYLAYTSWQII